MSRDSAQRRSSDVKTDATLKLPPTEVMKRRVLDGRHHRDVIRKRVQVEGDATRGQTGSDADARTGSDERDANLALLHLVPTAPRNHVM